MTTAWLPLWPGGCVDKRKYVMFRSWRLKLRAVKEPLRSGQRKPAPTEPEKTCGGVAATFSLASAITTINTQTPGNDLTRNST